MSSLCAGSRAAPPPHQQAMASRTILEFPDPRLRTRAQPVSGFDAALGALIDDLLETMYGASGVALVHIDPGRGEPGPGSAGHGLEQGIDERAEGRLETAHRPRTGAQAGGGGLGGGS